VLKLNSNGGEIKLDPWGYSQIADYEKLFSLFGIRPFKELLPKIKSPNHLMRRGVIFGHRDFDQILNALERGEKVALLTGFMPSGKLHFGHKMLMDQIIYYQSIGVDIILAIADIEAYAVRRMERKELIRIALEEYIANALALGLQKKNLRIYFQSNMEAPYYRLVGMFSQKVTTAEFSAIYGEISPAKVIAVLHQAADILHPMLEEYGGYKHVFVPVGADQDPHLRFTRDIADRFSGELDLRRPASTYHRFMTGLDGGKMSSSRPESAIFLSDPLEVSASKLMKAITGGRATVEEQRRLGGEPEKCSIYEMYLYHLLSNDADLLDIYTRCRQGKLLCGEDKKMAVEKMIKWLEEHQRKLEKAKNEAEKLVDVPRF